MNKFWAFFVVIMSIVLYFFIDTTSAANVQKTEALPKLYFEGSLEELVTKKDEETIRVKYESKEVNFDAYASIKLQGSSSLSYEKKNYNIKFYEDEDLNNKFRIDLGWGDHNKYCLKANWVDKTHSRNVVSANIAADVQKEFNLFENTPNNGEIDGYPIEIYLNNDFLGLYTLNIPKDEWMFNMDEDNNNHLVFSASDWSDSVLFHEEANFDDWEIEVGVESEENLVKLNRLFNFVINSTDEEFRENIDNYFNLDSLLNYYVILEFAQLKDNTAKNMLLSTYDGKVWYTTLYDFDASWGANWSGLALENYAEVNISSENNLFLRLKKNFPNELADRYFYLRGNILNKENIMKEFSLFFNSIPEDSFKKEIDRWRNIPGYDLHQISEFLDVHIPILDNYFFKMYTMTSLLTRVYEQKNINY